MGLESSIITTSKLTQSMCCRVVQRCNLARSLMESDRSVFRKWKCVSEGALLALGVLGGAIVSSACTEFEAGSDTLAATMELPINPAQGGSGGSLAGDPSGPWSCLGREPLASPPLELGSTTVTYSIFIADTVTRQPPPGLEVSACSPLDIECARPMAESVPPDADGLVRMRVPRNFSGFFRVLSDQTVPAVLFIAGAVQADTNAAPMLLIGQGPFQVLTQSQGVAIDPNMGHLLLRAYDCDRAPAAGIRFTNDKGGQPFAFVDGLPVVGQTITDAQGTAGFLNVLPGVAVVQSLQASSPGLLTRTGSGRVRAGWFTYIDLDAAR
jgi:hypothetical protein